MDAIHSRSHGDTSSTWTALARQVPAAEAIKAMVENNLVALPVLDKKKKLIGVVTLRDLLNRRDRGTKK